jgi:hypothetical protein
VTLKNAVIWDIKTQFVPHKRHITSPLGSPASYCYVSFEVSTAVTMKIAVFYDIKTQFVPHRRYITSPLESPVSYCYVRFEVSTAVTMKNVVFWDVNPDHTSLETYNLSAIELSRLMLCKISGFHGSDYEVCRLLEFYPVWLL